MNERIQELIEQAREYATTRHPVSNTTLSVNSDLFEQKFAELIVQECVSIVDKRKDQAIEEEWNVDEAMSAAEMDLLEHFGVES
jgi:hypothetical protein